MAAPKKRSAPPSKVGPAKKKAHVDASVSSSVTPAAASKNGTKKRARPVVQHESESEDGDEDDDDEEGGMDDFGVDEAVDEIGGGDEDEMDVDAEKPPKDPNAARESHKAQRLLHDQRKASKPHASLLSSAKRAWALARQKTNVSASERQRHVAALMDVLRGHVQEIVFKHDASRIVQTVVKRGDEKVRCEVAEELKGRYAELAQSKYSKFLVIKIARLCPSFRPTIVQELKPKLTRLLLHRDASRVLADIYELHANSYERALLVRELYGRETALFAGADQGDKELTKEGLEGVLKGLDAEKRRRVLGAVKENLQSIFDNSDKGSVRHAIVHRVLWEYLSALTSPSTLADSISDEERDRLRHEILGSCQDLLAEMVHTRDGSRVVREFLARGGAKERKQILKVLKPYVETMAKDDEAQLVLFTALDVTDDTKLLAKSIIAPIIDAAPRLRATAAGRRALLYPLVPRAPRHFTPSLTSLLSSTDAARSQTSKKSPEARAAEVRAAASVGLLEWVREEGAVVSRETAGSLVVLDVMLEADGDKTSASEALLKPLSAPYPSPSSDEPHAIDLPHTARMYKSLLHGGHFSRSTGTVHRADRWSAPSFAAAFVRIVGRDATLAMARGGGAFVVAALVERASEEGDVDLKTELSGWFDKFDTGGVEDGDGGTKGRKLLGERVRALRTAVEAANAAD